MDQPTVELIVRLTARLSATAFAAALVWFAAGYPHNRRRLVLGARLFAAFVVAHSIHFGTVAWLAVITAGANIAQRDGWALVVMVAILFYVGAFLILRSWGDAAIGRVSPRGRRVAATVAVAAIAAAFLDSYLGRTARMPVFWLPAAGIAGAVALYLVRTFRGTIEGQQLGG